ncbi:MAG: DEAD/DEAH box helicase, partial [Nitrospinaceae bacterium]|nr:DEAD/DEAH box helicase [Nitrospinaceae bacterium]
MTETKKSNDSSRPKRGRSNSGPNKSGGAGGRRGKPSSGPRKSKGPNTSLEKAISSIVRTVDSAPVTGTSSFDESTVSESFRELGLIPELLHGVFDMGYTEPSPIQTKAIPVAIKGPDLIGCAQTGTGKTAAFALPALQRMLGGSGTRTLALTPTRELAMQVADQFEKLGKYLTTQVALVYGGVDYEPQIQSLVNEADIVVATPGRLLDHMKRKTANFSNLEVLILDEADRMLDMGFAEEITEILSRLPSKRQT